MNAPTWCPTCQRHLIDYQHPLCAVCTDTETRHHAEARALMNWIEEKTA